MTVDWWVIATIVGMTAMTVVTRSFFFLSKRPWTLPHWAERGLLTRPSRDEVYSLKLQVPRACEPIQRNG